MELILISNTKLKIMLDENDMPTFVNSMEDWLAAAEAVESNFDMYGTGFDCTGFGMTGMELGVLLVGMIVSFVVSLLVIRGLMEYVRKHSFSAFGVYRIVLGVIVLAYFTILG